jgi:hypothetical protein
MNALQRFLEYARDFEATYADDDWSRLEQYFTEDAVYTVRGLPAFACRIEGRDGILRGLRKSVDGFDRRCERRVEVVGDPEVSENRVVVGWAVTYQRPGSPELRLPGRSTAEYAGAEIKALADDFGPMDETAVDDWIRAYGDGLDPSYV